MEAVIIGIKQNSHFGNSSMNRCPYATDLLCWRREFIIDEHYEILEHAIKMGYAKDPELRYNPKWCRMARRFV